MWEADRYDWVHLAGAETTPVGVPFALEMLRTAASASAADEAYRRIDNTVIVQGALYPAALPTAACIVAMLATCTPVARVRALELLEQISGGESEPGDEEAIEGISKEVLFGFSVYVDLLEHGIDMEREPCVELVLSCAQRQQELRDRVRFYLQKLGRDRTASARVREYASRRLSETAAAW
jgi:hypothetical protein